MILARSEQQMERSTWAVTSGLTDHSIRTEQLTELQCNTTHCVCCCCLFTLPHRMIHKALMGATEGRLSHDVHVLPNIYSLLLKFLGI